ncbi:DUF4158 domain-containing protein [Lacticaseibacillus paracasei]|nr:DUF4158 domain-containing protein [Lacticaseibacillus paracasei]UYI61313.1 DUF4158 domain-containing protein [Lacticaseibacillus paracasei]
MRSRNIAWIIWHDKLLSRVSTILPDSADTRQVLIKRKYHYQAFTDPAVKASLNDWLLERARFTNETEKLLFDMLLKKCLDEKILLEVVQDL